MSPDAARERPRRLPKKTLADALTAKVELSRRYFGDAYRISKQAHGRPLRLGEAVAGAACNLHAIGVGRKVADGRPTNTVCVRFYVTQKLPKRLLSGDALLPEAIAGVPTDIIEAPLAYFAAPAPVPCSVQRLRKQRPLRGGISGANATVVAGTLGARCRSRRPAEAHLQLVLSNNHVLADFGAAAAGSAILQPSVRDGGTNADRIATLLRAVSIQEGTLAANAVDAAVAVLDLGIDLQPDICTVGAIQGTTEPSVDLVVHKHGRTTGYTIGIIDDASCDVALALSRDDPTRVTQFVDQIRIKPREGAFRFAQAGDSGALLLTKATNLAVGLIFACPDDSSFAYANPITAVLDALDVDLN